MERLKNKEIFIGREPGQSRLMLAVNINGQHKTAVIGEFDSVPNSVSRCNLLAGNAHCKISVDNEGHMIITNLNPANITFVNNRGVQVKPVTTEAQIQLGADKYPLAVKTIVEAVKKIIPEVPKEYSIKHLEKIYEEYEMTMETIQKIQQKKSKTSMLPIMISMAIGLLSSILGQYVNRNSWFGLLLAVIPLMFYLRNYVRKDTSIEDRKAATNKLIDNYICPNPQCKHYLGAQPYKVIRQNHACPYCHCKWTDS